MSFGGGDSPSDTTYATQFQREAPQIEADKLGLMGTARELTRFGMNPWELTNKDAKFGDDDYGKYSYQGDDNRYAKGTEWDTLNREQRTQEGQPGGKPLPTQEVQPFNKQQQMAFDKATQGIGGFTPFLNQARDFAQQATGQYDPTGQTPGQVGYQQYMNPYQDEVIAGIEQQ